MRLMFAKGFIQKIQKESNKEKANLVYYDDYLRTFDEYKAFNWLFKTKVAQEYLPDLATRSEERLKLAKKTRVDP